MPVEEDKRALDLDAETASQLSQPMDKTSRQRHHPGHISAIVATCLMYLVLLAFNYFSGRPDGVMFTSTIGNNSDYHYFEITPAGWAFSIWGLIYLYQFVWLIYSVTTIFRTTPQSRLYLVPTIPVPALLLYITNNIAVIGWLFSFDRKMVGISFGTLIYTPLSLVVMLIICFRHQGEQMKFFNLANQRYEMVLLNGLVYNAWAVYLGWTICAMLLNFGFVLIYRIGMTQENAGTLVLAVLLIIIVVGCCLELTLFDKYLRYVVMHYVGPLVALFGSIYKQSRPNETNDHVPSGKNRTFATCILGVALIFTVLKIISIGIRAWKQPLYYKSQTERPAEQIPQHQNTV